MKLKKSKKYRKNKYYSLMFYDTSNSMVNITTSCLAHQHKLISPAIFASSYNN